MRWLKTPHANSLNKRYDFIFDNPDISLAIRQVENIGLVYALVKDTACK